MAAGAPIYPPARDGEKEHAVFTESLLEFHAPQGARRRWATLLSFAAEGVCIVALVLLPLFHIQALPNLFRLDNVIGPPAGPPASDEPARPRASSDASERIGTTVLAPRGFRDHAVMLIDKESLADEAPGPFVPGGTASGGGASPLSSILPTQPVREVTVAPPPSKLIISSGVSQGLLISQVKPVYPPLAIQARVQGVVVMTAIISRNGIIENLHVVSGHPLLVPAALDAVRHWRYRPYQLNGDPVEVETQITVNFTLGSGS